MGLFKNEVGRPSNETLKKRSIIVAVIMFVVVLAIGCCVFYTVNYFKQAEGSGKNISSGSKFYNIISIKNNSGLLYEDETRTNKGVLKQVGNKTLEVELTQSEKASLGVRTSYNKDITKGKLKGIKKYYYQVQVFAYDKNEREVSKSKKMNIKNTTVDQTITIGSSVTHLKIYYYNASKKHEEITASRVMIPIAKLTNMKKSFPDKAFRSCILDIVNDYCKNGVQKVTCNYYKENQDLSDYILEKNIGGITCDSKGIKNITGIEKMLNFKYISLKNNKLTSLDLSKNPRIEYIHADNNSIKTINLPVNGKYVKELTISSNQLTSINLKNAPELYHLDLRNNKITKIDLSNNTDLQYAYLSNNKLTSLDVSKNTKLAYLDVLNGNSIKKANIKVGDKKVVIK